MKAVISLIRKSPVNSQHAARKTDFLISGDPIDPNHL